jgi:Domain of Unknown Function (DUF748)
MAINTGTFSQLIRRLRSGLAVLLFGRKVLEAWAKTYLKRKLSESPNLEGSVGGVELYPLQGRAVLRDVAITRFSGGRRAVAARCEKIWIDIEWRALLHGTLVGRARLDSPHVQIFSDPDFSGQERDRDGKSGPAALLGLGRETERMMPFHLRSLELSEGHIEYLSQSTSPPFRLVLEELSISATNVTNLELPGLGPAHIFAEGRTTGNGRFWMRLVLPSLVRALTFDLQAGVNRMNLVDWNDVLLAFAKFDLKRGVCSIYSEFKVEDGRYQGYVQPHLQNLDVFAWQKEHGRSFIQICRQTAIAFLASVFKNKPRDELALNIPISGTFTDADVDTWSAVGSLLRNTFVHSLLSREQETEVQREPRSWGWPRFWRRRAAA